MTLCRFLTRLVKFRAVVEGCSWNVVIAQAGAEVGNGEILRGRTTETTTRDGLYGRFQRAGDVGYGAVTESSRA